MSTLVTKRSVTTGVVPIAADLVVGELAVNTADGKLYTKHTDNSIVLLNAAGGTKIVKNIVANYTILSNDDYIYCNAALDIVLTLPAAATNISHAFFIKNNSNYKVTIQGAELINGQSNLEIRYINSSLSLISDGTAWSIF